jgi:putative tryptophan/tyrosine transport system substrate-binding protein
MRRREFIFILGGAAAGLPLAAAGWLPASRAQQPAMPVIGRLSLGPRPNPRFEAPFHRGLAEAGYIPGENVAIEFRKADSPLQLQRFAADLVDRQVDVIVTTGSPYAAIAAKAATSTIPIVFMLAEDPVRYGLVTSLSRPGGNVTGMTVLKSELTGKRLDLLLGLVPQATRIAYLAGPSSAPVFEEHKNDVLAAARALGREIVILEGLDFEAAFANLAEQRAGALTVGNLTAFTPPRRRDKILELAARHKIAATYPSRDYVLEGGLMSYDSDGVDAARQLASQYVGRILKGAKPPELPVQRPNKFDLVINLKTAKALGLTIPRALRAAATELIS